MTGMNMSQMVGEVRRLTYGTLTEQLNLIKSDYTALQTEIFLDMDTNQIQPGMILSSNLNVWYVRQPPDERTTSPLDRIVTMLVW